jgi:hypothetical protein
MNHQNQAVNNTQRTILIIVSFLFRLFITDITRLFLCGLDEGRADTIYATPNLSPYLDHSLFMFQIEIQQHAFLGCATATNHAAGASFLVPHHLRKVNRLELWFSGLQRYNASESDF